MEQIFHPGELAVQQLAGEAEMASRNGKIIIDCIIPNAISFIQNQSFVVISSEDSQRDIWTSVIYGEPGFTQVINPQELVFYLEAVHTPTSDPLFTHLFRPSQVGILFIELATRKRFRVNGVASLEGKLIKVRVQEAYPNCPKYIQRRVISTHSEESEQVVVATGTQFSEAVTHWIQRADTFFVGTRSSKGYLDASHRGGNLGFVELLNAHTLRIPDYRGNSMFNTLGNIYQDAHVGLLFVDFETGNTLQLTGKAQLEFDARSKKALEQSGGTGRFWTFEAAQWKVTHVGRHVSWKLVDYSPFNP